MKKVQAFTFIVGLLFPGLGFWIQKRWLDGLLVTIGIVTPLFWTLLMTTQQLNDRVLVAAGKSPATIFDGQIWSYWSEIPTFSPHIVVLFVTTLVLHIMTARSAAKVH